MKTNRKAHKRKGTKGVKSHSMKVSEKKSVPHTRIDKSVIPNRDYYVVMTDSFMSGWGGAKGKTNKFVIGTNDYSRARQLQALAKKRPEMKYVSIRTTKPYYKKSEYKISYRNASQIGWK